MQNSSVGVTQLEAVFNARSSSESPDLDCHSVIVRILRVIRIESVTDCGIPTGSCDLAWRVADGVKGAPRA